MSLRIKFEATLNIANKRQSGKSIQAAEPENCKGFHQQNQPGQTAWYNFR